MTQSSVERTLGILLGKVEGIEDRLVEADQGRQLIHQRLDQLVIRTTHLESDVFTTKQAVDTTKTSVEAMKGVTDDVVMLRQRAEGAGTLGRWLYRIAVWSIGAAGWLIGLYTWLTG